MSKFAYTRYCAAAACLLAASRPSCVAATSADVRLSRPATTAAFVIPLPPLATITQTGGSTETWRQTGAIHGTVISAEREFSLALRQGGWKIEKSIALGRAPGRSKLILWTRRKQRVLLMLWETEIGACGFAWGDERARDNA